MSDNINIKNMRQCIGCKEYKAKSMFKKFQIACKACEDNEVEYEKICEVCNESKLNTLFRQGKKCIACENKYRRDTNKNSNSKNSKECGGCHEIKTKDKFRRGQIVCGDCESNPDVEYKKMCVGCNELKSNMMFRTNRKKCLDCERYDGRNYRRTTTKASEWVEENRERMSELQHNHYEKNKKEIRKKETERLKEDPHLLMIKSYRNGICKLLNGRLHSNKKLETTRIQYIAWMNFCFEDDMNIENHATCWQVDHVLALDIMQIKKIGKMEFEKDSDFSCLLGWYNTMPVSCSYNMKKNKYFDKEQLALHIRTLSGFLKKYEKSLNIKITDNLDVYQRLAHMVLDD